MAPKSLDPWLAQLLKDEIAAVIDWKTTHHVKGVKSDPDCRFSDDGSNFRSEVDSPPGTCEVQLIEVLTSEDIVTVYVADGNLKVKARLSAEAVATFEEELGDPITTETCGDILQLKKFTIISTPFGPAEGFVQLQIDEIGYRNEVLRRTFGNPSPVEENYSIRTLIESIKLLRIPKVSPENGGNDQVQPQVLPNPAAPSVSASSVNRSQQVVQTQAPVEQKPRGPTLGRDGYEVEGGLNLQGPVEPISKDAQGGAVNKSANNSSALLGLFKQVKAPAASSANANCEIELREQQKLYEPQKTASAVTLGSASEVDVPVSATSAPQRSSKTLAKPTGIRAPRIRNIAADKVSEYGPPSAQPSTEVRRATPELNDNSLFYRRRKVPDKQRNLLDSSLSWFPSLPGKQFPQPNVPIELLMTWNVEKAAKAAARTSDPDLSQRSAGAPSQKPASLSEASADSDSDSELSDAASQEFTPSPSQNLRARGAAVPATSFLNSTMDSDVSMDESSRPPSESPSRPMHPDLPPSSILGSVVHATPMYGELEVATPRPLPIGRPSNKRKAEELKEPPSKRQSMTPNPNVITPGPGTSPRHALPNRPIPPPSTSPAMSVPQISSQAAFDPVTGLSPQLSSARPYSSQHPTSQRWQPTSSSRESVQRSRPSPPPADRYAPTQPKQSSAQATTPLELFRQGKLTHPPPSGPRSSMPHRYQGAQLQGMHSSFRNRASDLGELQRYPVEPPSVLPLESLSQASACSSRSIRAPRQSVDLNSQSRVRQTVIVDNTDPATERISQSISRERLRYTATAQMTERSPAQSSWQPQDASTQLQVVQESMRSPGQSQTTMRQPRGMLFRRKAWIKLNYMASRNGNTSLQVVLQKYRQAFPDDNDVGIEELLVAARHAFDKMNVDLEMRFVGRFAGSKAYAMAKQELADTLQYGSQPPISDSQHGTGPVLQINTSASTAQAESSPWSPNHATLIQQQARRQFMNEERRKEWLKGAYVPASNGTVQLAALLDDYKHACPEDFDVKLEDVLSAAQAVFRSPVPNQPDITASASFSRTLSLSTMRTMENRMAEKDAHEQRRKWLRRDYVPTLKGKLLLATVMARYQHSCPNDKNVNFDSFLKAGRAAHPAQGVTPAMTWRSSSDRDPAQEHRMRIRPDIQRWLKTRYCWDLEGRCREADMLTTYQTLHPDEANAVHLSFFRGVVETAFKMSRRKKKVGKDRWYFTDLQGDDTIAIVQRTTNMTPSAAASSTAQSNGRASSSTSSKEVFTLSKCRQWLKQRFFQDPNGSYSIEDVAVAYEEENPGGSRAPFDQAMHMLFKTRGRDAGDAKLSRISEPAGSQSRSQMPKHPVSQRDAEAAQKSYQEWFQKHYVRDGSGTLSIRDLIQGYKHQHPSKSSTKDGALVKALRKAFGLFQKTTRFSSLNNIPLPSRTAHDSTSLDKETTTNRQPPPGLINNVGVFENPALDSTSSITEFCAAYLGLGSAKGNAFANTSTRTKTKNNLVDVLSWNL